MAGCIISFIMTPFCALSLVPACLAPPDDRLPALRCLAIMSVLARYVPISQHPRPICPRPLAQHGPDRGVDGSSIAVVLYVRLGMPQERYLDAAAIFPGTTRACQDQDRLNGDLSLSSPCLRRTRPKSKPYRGEPPSKAAEKQTRPKMRAAPAAESP